MFKKEVFARAAIHAPDHAGSQLTRNKSESINDCDDCK